MTQSGNQVISRLCRIQRPTQLFLKNTTLKRPLKYYDCPFALAIKMDEEAKKASKSYSLEEPTALMTSGKEEIFPASGAKDWIENPTRFKLREAKYFFLQVEKTYNDYLKIDTDQNRDTFLFNLGAFFSAARSITYYMQIQYAEKDQFWEWYCPQQRRMKEDREMRFLKDLRVNFIHFRPPIVTPEKEASYLICATVVYSEGHPLYGTPLPERTPVVSAPPKARATNVIFKAGQTIGKKSLPDDTEVIQFCSTQLDKLEQLVSKCENQFNKPPRDPCDEIYPDIPPEGPSS